MSDAGTTTAAPDPGAGSAGLPGASPAASTEPGGDLFASPLGNDEPFVSRGFAENLRAEGLKYRTDLRDLQARYNPYEVAFGGYNEGDREVWFELARNFAADPVTAAAQMRAISDAIYAENGGAPEPEPEPSPEPTSPPPEGGALTADQVQKMIADALGQRDTQANEDRMVETVLTEIRAEGFDPENAEGFMLMWLASNETGGDVKAAAQKVRDYRQSIIDGYVQGRANGSHLTPSAPGTAATEAPQAPGSWDDVRRQAARYIEAVNRNGG